MMPTGTARQEQIWCLTPEGRELALVTIFAPTNPGAATDDDALSIVSSDASRDYSEERVQLFERMSYEYVVKPVNASDDLILRDGRGIRRSSAPNAGEDRGLIEPQDYCGLFPLVIVRRGDPAQTPLASAGVEVRSRKLGYREDYRRMLSFIADKSSGLLLDSRSPTSLRLDNLWRSNPKLLEQQLEFLRHLLQAPAFRAAVDEVLRNPHRRLGDEREERDISRPFKAGKDIARQIAVSSRRIGVPALHPLRPKVASLPARISAQSRQEFLDTAENRFAKMVLVQFRDFLVEIATSLEKRAARDGSPETQRLMREAERLRGGLETQLARGFLPDISAPTLLPLGSPVLQRKAGYRELLQFWLQFHAGAQLAWDGGSDVFHAGARNVATLYEYWLFFQLEQVFRQKFACDQPLHALLIDKTKAPPQLVLRRNMQLKTPVSGSWSNIAGRHLRAEFQFNRKFTRKADRAKAGSWTRGVQPDYTISIWPATFSRDEAEEKELMVHVHFDAKYRVDRASDLLGDESDDAAFASDAEEQSEPRSAAKYADLLKMHAYRDAVRRTAGAYVLYPGNPEDGNKLYQGFHEVLPGLGAFAVRPGPGGKANGMATVSDFLDKVIEHLANRATSRERATYHVAETYGSSALGEQRVPYALAGLSETDLVAPAHRAPPPAEDMVLVAWYDNDAQLDLARDTSGFLYIRLGRRQGAFHVHPNLAKVQRAVMHTHASTVAPGLLVLREPGFRVFTRAQLRAELNQHAKGAGVAAWQNTAGADDDEYIYALFRTTADETFAGRAWNDDKLMTAVEEFEADARNKPVENLGRTSPYPRILSLQSVLSALA